MLGTDHESQIGKREGDGRLASVTGCDDLTGQLHGAATNTREHDMATTSSNKAHTLHQRGG